VLLIEVLRKKLVEAVQKNMPFETEVLSNLAMMVFKQQYDESAELQDKQHIGRVQEKVFRRHMIILFVQSIGAELLAKYESGYLSNVLITRTRS